MQEDKQKTQPTRSQIELIMSDWLGGSRDADTFIHKNTDGAIERSIGEGRFSDWFNDGLAADGSELLRQAREIAQQTISSMTDMPLKVHLGTDGSYTDGQQINLATKYFDDAGLSPAEKVDILTGYAIHEACHINHSDFEQITRVRSQGTAVSRLKGDLMNIIEDERIEQLLGKSTENGGDGMPGYADYIGCAKKHAFGTYKKDISGMQQPTSRIPRFLNTLLLAVRYPSQLDSAQVTEEFEALDKVRHILTPFPTTSIAVEHAADRIVEVMRDMMEEEQQQQQQQQQQQSGQDGGSGGNGSNGGGDGQGGKEGGSKTGKAAALAALEAELSSKQAQDMMKVMEMNAKSGQPLSDGSKDASAMRRSSYEKEYANGEAELDTAGAGASRGNITSYIRKGKGDKDGYLAALANVRRYIPAMSKALRCRTQETDYELRGMPSGLLDMNLLPQVAAGNKRVFSRHGKVTADSACICMLIDESGSMSGQRLAQSRQAAVLVNEAVKGIPNLELFVYGFTTNELNIYHERKAVSRYALGSTKADGGTPTAQAMGIAARRVRRLTSSRCLMMVLTDGLPDNERATKEQDRLLARQGFVPVGVDIAGGTAVQDIFCDAISVEDVGDLAPFVGKLVKNRLLRNIRRHESA